MIGAYLSAEAAAKRGTAQNRQNRNDADKAWCTMKPSLRRTIGAGAAALIILMAGAPLAGVAAQDAGWTHKARNAKTAPVPPPAAGGQPQKLPPRAPFTAADATVARVPGMPDARFWADSEPEFEKAMPPPHRPALNLP